VSQHIANESYLDWQAVLHHKEDLCNKQEAMSWPVEINATECKLML